MILGRTGKTGYNFPVTIVATIANVILNLILVPAWGIVGAGVALIVSYLIVIVLIYLVSRRIFPIPWQWGRLAVVVGAAVVLVGGGEALLPTDGAVGFLSRALLFALYPVILWFGGAISRDERRQVNAILREGNLRERLAAMRAEAADGERRRRPRGGAVRTGDQGPRPRGFLVNSEQMLRLRRPLCSACAVLPLGRGVSDNSDGILRFASGPSACEVLPLGRGVSWLVGLLARRRLADALARRGPGLLGVEEVPVRVVVGEDEGGEGTG